MDDKKINFIKKFKGGFNVDFSNDDGLLCVVSKYITFYETNTFNKIEKLYLMKNCDELCFSNHDKRIAVKNTSGDIVTYNIQNKDVENEFITTKIEGCNVIFSENNEYIYTGDWDGNIIKVDINTTQWETYKIADDSKVNSIYLCKESKNMIIIFYKRGYLARYIGEYNLSLDNNTIHEKK